MITINEAIEDCNNEAIFACVYYWCERGQPTRIERVLWFLNLQLAHILEVQ